MTERDIFLAALDLPTPADRAEYVRSACGADTDRLERVDALLRSHEVAGSFLGTPAVAPPDADQSATCTISVDTPANPSTHPMPATDPDAGLVHFAGCRGLAHLNLRGTKVTDAGLAPFAGYDRLETLRLGHTTVTEVGLAHFAGCRQLTMLDLDVLPITDAGLAPFAGCLGLEELRLGGTQVTDAGLAPFRACTRLKRIHLNGSKVTAAGVAALTAARPGCRIEWDGGVIDPAAVAALPPAEQLEAVRREIVQRNPGFDGLLRPSVENGAVTGLEFAGAAVADLTPLRALPRLKVLNCKAEGLTGGKLADLSPLKGLPLVKLNVSVSQIV